MTSFAKIVGKGVQKQAHFLGVYFWECIPKTGSNTPNRHESNLAWISLRSCFWNRVNKDV